MPRLARIVVPGAPHHVAQRGNRRQTTFFTNKDYQDYLGILREQGKKYGIQFWAYCLMPNHVHLIAIPETAESLNKGIGETHRLYTRRINARMDWKGYLWQGRFSSFPMDEKYLIAAIRYIERNPVRAGLVKKAEDYPYSSARAHTLGQVDPLLSNCFLSQDISNWSEFLEVSNNEEELHEIRSHVQSGRPLSKAAKAGTR